MKCKHSTTTQTACFRNILFHYNALKYYTDSNTGGSNESRSTLAPVSSVVTVVLPLSPCISINFPTKVNDE